MDDSTEEEFVSLDDLALELSSGAQAAARIAPRPAIGPVAPGTRSATPRLGAPTAAEVHTWLTTRLDPLHPELVGKNFSTNEHALSVHCTASITQGALGLLKRMAGH